MVTRPYCNHHSLLAVLYSRHASEKIRRGRLYDSGGFGIILSSPMQVLSMGFSLNVSQACTLAQSILAILQVKNGFGRNIQYLRPTEIKNVNRDIFITIMFNLTGTYFVRISVCFFMLQLLPFTQRFSRWYVVLARGAKRGRVLNVVKLLTQGRWTYGIMVFCTVIALATILSLCFICIPLHGFWDSSIKTHCMSRAVTAKINKVQGCM